MADQQTRERVVRFANAHGPRAAARHFGVKLGTVKGWQGRARKRTPAQQYVEAARRILAWAQQGACLRCGGAGYLSLPHPARRYAYRVVCPDCGRPRSRLVVTGTRRELDGRARQADWQAVQEREAAGDTGHREAWR